MRLESGVYVTGNNNSGGLKSVVIFSWSHFLKQLIVCAVIQ